MQLGKSIALAEFRSSIFRPLGFPSYGKMKFVWLFKDKNSSFSPEKRTAGRVDI
jgi:hypothetical protein